MSVTSTRAPWRRRILTGALALTCSVSIAACTTPEEGGAGAGGTDLAIALPFKPVSSLSPYSDDAVYNTRMGIAETLIALDKDGKPTPWLAESWETVGDDTVEFKLRKDVKFHDGSALTAAAAANALKHAVDSASRPKGLGKNDLEFTATDEHTLTVKSAKADPILVQRFADPGSVILSEAAYEGESPNLKGTGTGPFQLEESSDTEATSRAFADYWNGKPALENLKVQFIEDGSARANAVRTAEVNLAQAIPLAQLGEVSELTTESTPLPRGVYLHLNNKKGAFTDAGLRAAAAAAVDPDSIVDSIYEGHAGKAHGSLFNEDTSWAKDVKSANTTSNAAKPNDKEITLATWNERPELPEVASVVAEQLRKAGFQVNVTVSDYKSMETALLEGQYDAVIGSRNYQSGAADPVSFLSSDYTCEGSYNLSLYCNAEIDAEIQQADAIADPEKRYAEAAAIGAKIVADNAVIPLAHEYSLLSYKDVNSLYFDPFERRLVTHETSR